ncbi:hypothetical protein BDK51DRAFT_8231, partial [Blyttiomyces helicus]
LRYETLISLTRALKGAGKSSTDLMIKDFLKIAKSGLTDKMLLIRVASAEVIHIAVYTCTSQPPPMKADEYDALLNFTTKALEGANYSVRRAVASLFGTIVGLSQRPPLTPKGSPKRAAKAGAADSSAGNPGDVGASDVNILTVDEILAILSSLFAKATSNDAKVGIAEAFAATFKQLGITFVESHYPAVSKTIIDLAANPKLTSTKQDSILMRNLCGFLLRDVVGKMLSEAGQIAALKELGTGWLRKWPAVMANDVAPPDLALICVLHEVAALLVDLGPAASVEQDTIVEPLVILMGHTSRSVNLALSWCLMC